MKTSSRLANVRTVEPYFIHFVGSSYRDIKALSIDTRYYNYPVWSTRGVHRLTKATTNISGVVSDWSIVDQLMQQNRLFTIIEEKTIYSVETPPEKEKLC